MVPPSHLIIELLISKMTAAEKTMKLFKIRLELKFMGELSIISMMSSLPADTLTGIFISSDLFAMESPGYDCQLP